MLNKVYEMALCVFGAVFVMLGGGLMVGGLINTGNPHLEKNLLYILISIGVGLFSLGAMFLIVMEYSYRS